MGRKPDPVVFEHFTRGAKLKDTSNRYQYTCKQCGERFPKGRIESLYNHMTKKCAASSSQAKSDLVLQIHHNHGLASDAAAPLTKKPRVEKSQISGLASSPRHQQKFNRLNMLAEVVATQNSHPPACIAAEKSNFTVSVLDPSLRNSTLFTHAENADQVQRMGIQAIRSFH